MRQQAPPEETKSEGGLDNNFVPIVLNGEPYQAPPQATIRLLVAELGLAEDRVAVELDRKIVKRGLWAKTQLRENALIEVVHFVGGG